MNFRKVKSTLGIAFFVILFGVFLFPIFHLMLTIFVNGIKAISSNFPGFFYEERALPGSDQIGGIGPYLLGTLVLVGVATLIALPISIFAVIYTTQSMKGKVGPITSTIARTIIEFPTIIVGLTVYGALLALDQFFKYFGLQNPIPKFSAISGAIALAIIMIPFIYTQIEDGLNSVPSHLREAIYSLGASRIRASFVMIRYIKATVLTAIAIGIGKAMGETAPLLFTAFGYDFYPPSGPQLLFNPIGSLTLAIYNSALSPYRNWIELAWGAALILLLMSLSLFVVARILSRRR